MGAQVCGVDGAYGSCACNPIANDEPTPDQPVADLSCSASARNAAKLIAADEHDPEMPIDPMEIENDLLGMCMKQQWSEQLRTCLVEARHIDDLDPCEQYLPDFSDEKDGDEKVAKVPEVHEMVMRIYQGARAYYMDPPPGGWKGQPQFPEPSAGPNPPLGTCCQSGGQCSPDFNLWAKAPWMSLMFSVDDPSYYSYEYTVDNTKQEYYARAYGDLDCDGQYSTFEYRGFIDSHYSDGPPGSPVLREVAPLE
jgi:hypothetical protein